MSIMLSNVYYCINNLQLLMVFSKFTVYQKQHKSWKCLKKDKQIYYSQKDEKDKKKNYSLYLSSMFFSSIKGFSSKMI